MDDGEFLEAVAAHQRGDLLLAESLYRASLQHFPQRADTLANLGLIAHQYGRLNEAIQWLTKATRLQPMHAGYAELLGKLQAATKQHLESIATLRRAIALGASSPQTRYLLADALQETGKLVEAEAEYRIVVRIQPEFAEAWNNLGVVMHEQGKINEACAAYEAALRLVPNYVPAWNNLGVAHQKMQRWKEAFLAFRKSLELEPEQVIARKGLGVTFLHSRRFDEAIEMLRDAIKLDPHDAESYFNLGLALESQSKIREAAEAHERASHLSSYFSPLMSLSLRQQLNVSSELETATRNAFNEYLAKLPTRQVASINPFSLITLKIESTPAEQLAFAQYWVRERYSHIEASPITPTPEEVGRSPGEGIRVSDNPLPARSPTNGTSIVRVGYISPDFRSHAAVILMADVFKAHDRSSFDVHAYALGPPDDSPYRHRVKLGCDRFSDVENLTSAQIVEQVRRDRIDILVDLSGYSKQTRPEILAMRAAPVQVSYLGYASTMGANFVDYLIADETVVPLQDRVHFTEKLAYLPDCYQANTIDWEISQGWTRSKLGVSDDTFIFCSFNSSYKITSRIFEVWLRLLQKVPKSILWLLEAPISLKTDLHQLTRAAGIDPSRVVFLPIAPISDHFARLQLADLFLDCFPVNAHTTASDALRAGLPMVTLAGESFISRVAGSLLNAVGLSELVTRSPKEYEDLALHLATDREQLEQLRARLSVNVSRSQLFDSRLTARKLEAAFMQMLSRSRHRLAPQSFRVRPDLTIDAL